MNNKNNKQQEKQIPINRLIPSKLHKKCKYKALELNITFGDLLIDALTDFVNDNKVNKKKGE